MPQYYSTIAALLLFFLFLFYMKSENKLFISFQMNKKQKYIFITYQSKIQSSVVYQSQSKKVVVKQLEDSTSADKGLIVEQVELHSSKQIEQTKSARNQASSYQEQEASSCQEKTVKLNNKLHKRQCSLCSVNKTCTLNDLQFSNQSQFLIHTCLGQLFTVANLGVC